LQSKIEGDKDEEDDRAALVLRCLRYALRSKQIKWRAYTADGRYVDTELKAVQDRVLQWSIGQNVRFTMNLSENDKWSEVGEFSQDGKNWMKFFEMTLQRVK